MSTRGTRTFPPAGIRGPQGNQGERGPGIYTFDSVALNSTSITDNQEVTYLASAGANGTIKAIWTVSVAATNIAAVTITPLVNNVALSDFVARANAATANDIVNICVIIDYPVNSDDSIELKFNFSAGSGTIRNSAMLYSIEE